MTKNDYHEAMQALRAMKRDLDHEEALRDSCPRCGAAFDASRGALSRVDNATRVCDACGMAEAMWDHDHKGAVALPPLDRKVWQ